MPKPKAAKAKADAVDGVEAREVLQLLDSNADPPAETLHRLFRLNMGPCSTSCGKSGKGTPQNPCCFHGLLPAENGFRKKGLWQREPVLGQLGHDPSDDKQQVLGAPAGLRNLGNTCYVNAAMQFLHSLPAFRNALYVLEPQLAEQDIVRQLRDLFIELHFGPKRYVDPEPFVNSLLLDHAIQQDGQEFLKLLLSKLEGVFAASKQPGVASVIPGLFQGHLSHVTTCHTCNQPSEGSRREVEFYELSLQVQHMPSLHHSLVAALAPDELVGDNQYFCDFCGAKSDADRRMRLRNLPPYLCLALQRFTYDQQTWEKKKVLHKLPIPLRLDVGQVLSDAGLPLPEAAPLGHDKQPLLPGSPNSTYELVAVLIHKGTSASHGHYVAHIKLNDTGTWWRFDDEEVQEMGQQPTSHPADHGTTAAAAAAASGAAATAAAAADEEGKPAVGKKRGRGGSAGGAGSTAKRGRGASRGGRGRRGGKKANKREPWEDEDSDADAEAEAATAAAEAVDPDELAFQQAMQLSLAEMNGDVSMTFADYQQAAAADGLVASGQAAATVGHSRRATDSSASRARGRGRSKGSGRGRGRDKGAAADAAEDQADNTGAGPNEQDPTVPPALVEQILSANAYFLVYKHCPPVSQQPADMAAVAAAETAATKQQALGTAGPLEQPMPAEAAPAAAAEPGLQSQHEEMHQSMQQQGAAGQPQLQLQPLLQRLQQLQQQQQGHILDRPAGTTCMQPAASAGEGEQQQPQLQPQLQAQQTTASHTLAQQQGIKQPPETEQQLPLAAQQLQAQLRELPEAVQQQVAQLHREYADTCSRFQQKKQEALAAVADRQQEVSTIVGLLPVPEGDSGCFICLNWLETWVNSEASPDPLDNSVLLCKHHKLNPLLPSATYKYISDAAWQQLMAHHRGGPRLTVADVCLSCLRRHLEGLVNSEDLVGLREQLLEALEGDEAKQERMDAGSYYVSKTWVAGFKRRTTGAGVTGRLDPPTAGITCPHSSLLPEGRTGASKRFAVSAGTWSMLRRLWVQQVLADVQAKRDKAARAAAKRAAAGGLDLPAAAATDMDDDVIILDSPTHNRKQQEGGGQGDGADDMCIKVDAAAEQPTDNAAEAGSAAGAEPAEAGTIAAAAAAAAAATSWQPPLPLDGSVQLSEAMLLQALPEFNLANSFDCEVCAVSLQEAAAGHQEVKQQLEGEKQVLGKLLAGSVTEALEPDVTYYLVPNAWLDVWRKHLNAALSRKLIIPAQLPPAPEPLPQAVRSLLCSCHPQAPLLAVPLPAIVNKRGRFSQADPQQDALRVVTAHEWQQLLLHHSGLEADADSDGATAATTAQSTVGQQATGGAAGGTRPRRRGAKSAEQDDSLALLQRQEQRQVLVQCIASMSDTDVGFRGIQARLHVAPVELHEQQPPQQPQPQLQHQQQAEAVQQAEQQAEQQAGGQLLQDALQNGCCSAPGASEPLHQQPQELQANSLQVTPDQQQQQQQQQQHACAEEGQVQQAVCSHARDDAAVVAAEALDGEEPLDLTCSPPQAQRRSTRLKQTAVVDLSGSPKAAAPAAADTDVVMVEAVDLATAQANGHGDGVVIEEVVLHSKGDSLQGPDEGKQQPDGTSEVKGRTQRPSGRRTAGSRANAAAMASGDATVSSDSDEACGTVGAAAARRGLLQTDPGPCEETLQAEAAARRAATLVYEGANLMVELVTEDELQAAVAASGAAGERRSRRARKNRQPVKASSLDTLSMLRLHVFEALSVHPKNQRLYVRGQLLQGEQDTLAKLEIFPDEEIRLVNANIVPDDDYASVFDGVPGKRKAREVEVGFKDTALHGPSIPVAAGAPAEDSRQPHETSADQLLQTEDAGTHMVPVPNSD